MDSQAKSVRFVLSAALFTIAICAVGAFASAEDNPLGLKPHHVKASVVDIDRAVKWYQDALGFKLTSHGDRGPFKFAELEIPGYGIGLLQSTLPAVTVPAGSMVRPSWLHVVFSVPDPDAAYRLLKKRGFDVFVRAGSDAPPLTSFLIHDSEGNELEFVAPRS